MLQLKTTNVPSGATARPLIAAVDLGSNSFRLLIAEVEANSAGHHLRLLDQIKESVRLGAGLDQRRELGESAQQRAIEALARLAERIRHFDPANVRAVATNTFRVARNAQAFLERASAALGFPIEVIAGREEARLIYVGASHALPVDGRRRLVVDIGGGSTECIIGVDHEPLRRESLDIGCVSVTREFFASGAITRGALRRARIHCAERLAGEVRAFRRLGWHYSVGTSGSAKALIQIATMNFGVAELTTPTLRRIENLLLEAGSLDALQINGLKPDRQAVIAGSLCVMQAVFEEFGIESMSFCESALREGVLHDLLGRASGADRREITISHLVERYRLDPRHGEEVAIVAADCLRQLVGGEPDDDRVRMLQWAARIRELGAFIAHADAHKHGAYIVQNADLPGFSRDEQSLLAVLVLGQTGGLRKLRPFELDAGHWQMVLALRLAVILQRRRDGRKTPLSLRQKGTGPASGWIATLPAEWVAQHPLTDQSLAREAAEWREAGPWHEADYQVSDAPA
ncbi:MAG: exopolyphosphatase [Lautropia sp.]